MRWHRLYSYLFGALLISFGVTAFAATSIQSAVGDLKDQIQSDKNAIADFTCGGLLAADERVSAYYRRKRQPLNCTLTVGCETYDSAGACVGTPCELARLLGAPSRWFLAGSNPPKSCSPGQYREWECGIASAKCYSFDTDIQYSESWFPSAYNCAITYTDSPVFSDEPKGKQSLTTPYSVPAANRPSTGPWESAQGSNITVESAPDYRKPKDSSLTAIDLDTATSASVRNVRHPVVAYQLRQFFQYPDLEQTIGRLLQPPEIRLILPKGGLSLQHENSPLFTRIFSSLGNDPPLTPVEKILGNEPDALRTAAEYLRSIPLMEVEYVPVNILIPHASVPLLHQLKKEWEVWLLAVQSELDPIVVSTVQQNIITLQSYIDLQESVRTYRLHFPRYIDALLSYTESANRFFRTEWVQVNADRLDDWYAALTSYLPELQKDVHTLYEAASGFTSACLAQACRANIIPVQSHVQPWAFTSSEIALTGDDRAWLPQGFPLWGTGGQTTWWHPTLALGQPLPDITLDFSELFLDKNIQVPVLKVEMHDMDLPFPPSYNAANVGAHMGELRSRIQPLPNFSPPLFNLTFPKFTLPDPKTSLFIVPKPPQAMPTWKNILMQKINRLQELQTMCDPSRAPKRFLVHEFLLHDASHTDPRFLLHDASHADHGAMRAAAFVSRQGLNSGSWGVSLKELYDCPGCSTVRPQRYIRQHFQFDASFDAFQDILIHAIDEWNAQVKFASVIDRDELLYEDFDYQRDSGLLKDLSPSLTSP